MSYGTVRPGVPFRFHPRRIRMVHPNHSSVMKNDIPLFQKVEWGFLFMRDRESKTLGRDRASPYIVISAFGVREDGVTRGTPCWLVSAGGS